MKAEPHCAAARIAAAAALVLAAADAAVAGDEARLPGEEKLDEAAFRRSGFSIGVAVGPQLTVGAPGVTEAAALGGGLSLRFGTVATEDLQWILELASGGFLISFEGDETTFNSQSVLTLGGQYWLRDVFWLRGGLGFSAFLQRESRGGAAIENSQRGGLALTAGGGYDLLRRGIFALDLELLIAAAAYEGDRSVQGGLFLGATWY